MPNSECCETSSIQIGHSNKFGPYFRCRTCQSYWHREPGKLFAEGEGSNLVPVYNGKGELGLTNLNLLGVDIDAGTLMEELFYPNLANSGLR